VFTKGVTDHGRAFYRSDTGWVQVSGSMQIFDKVQSVKIALQEIPVVFILFDTPPPEPPAKTP
jgi:hypothetical protein